MKDALDHEVKLRGNSCIVEVVFVSCIPTVLIVGDVCVSVVGYSVVILETGHGEEAVA